MAIEIKTLEDIQNLINNKIKESLTLEYKRELGDNNTKIAEDVSAFANTSGGTIIYGIREDGGLPASINWIKSKGVKERIENIALSNIQPKAEGIAINPIENPKDASQAIFVVNIQESLEAPHMVEHRYYKRYNFQSVPMEDNEVKNAMFKKGLRGAIKFEISRNLELADQTLKLMEKIYHYQPEKRKPLVFMPFHTEAWRSIVSSGLLSVLKEKATKLIGAYNLITEINYIIDYHRYGKDVIVTPVYTSAIDEGTYVPAILNERIQKLYGMLSEFKDLSW
jgi:hypothetical protein